MKKKYFSVFLKLKSKKPTYKPTPTYINLQKRGSNLHKPTTFLYYIIDY